MEPTNRIISNPPDPVFGWTNGALLAILAAASVIKLVVFFQLRDHPLLQPDSGLDTTAYADLARRVVAGDWALGPGLYFVSPFYIYFAASVLEISGSFTVLRLVQLILGLGTITCIYLMAREWFGEAAARIAGLLAAFTGLFTFYEVLILQSSVDACLTAAALWTLTVALRHGRPRRFVVAGLIFGIQTLNRPNMLAAALGVAVVLLIVRNARASAWLAAGLALGIAPAAVRNAVVAHQFSLVSSHGGLNFFIGNNAQASGFYQLVAGVAPTIGGQEADTRRVAERAVGHALTDAQVSDYFFDQAWQWIRREPAKASWLFVKKIGYAFHAQHVPLPHSYPFYVANAAPALRLAPIGPWLLTPLGLVGLVAAAPRERRLAYAVWASFVPLYAAAVAVFFIADRYRLPLLPPLCAGAGGGLAAGWRAIRARDVRFAPAGVAVLIVAVLANVPIAASDGRWVEGLRLAQRFAMQGRFADAEAWAARLDAEGPPRPGAGSAGVGMQLLEQKDPGRALPYLRRAHDLDPADAAVDYALGRAQQKSGLAAEAVPHLRRGFDAGIELPDGGLDYALALEATGAHDAAAAAAARIHPPEETDPEGWLRLGRVAMEAKAPPVAERFFRRAVELRPDAAARQQYGLCLLVERRFDEAARELAEAVRLDPANADSLSHLAYCELALGRAADARAHVRAALALAPDDPFARQLAVALGERR